MIIFKSFQFLLLVSFLGLSSASVTFADEPKKIEKKISSADAIAIGDINSKIAKVKAESEAAIMGMLEGRNSLITAICDHAKIPVKDCDVDVQGKKVRLREAQPEAAGTSNSPAKPASTQGPPRQPTNTPPPVPPAMTHP